MLGRPIHGEVSHYGSPKIEQWGAEKFIEELDKILDFPGVESVRWEQYTPYFNDGEACEFSVYELRVKFADDDESGDYEDGYLSAWEMSIWDRESEEIYAKERYAGIYELLRGFLTAHFEDVLREHFGDPAQVTATKQGFDREFYDHD